MSKVIDRWAFVVVNILFGSVFMTGISPVFITIMVSFLGLLGVIRNRWGFLGRVFKNSFSVGVCVFFLYCVGSYFGYRDIGESVRFLQPKIILWVFPLVLIQFDFNRNNYCQILNTFVYACWGFGGLIWGISLWKYCGSGDVSYLYIDHLAMFLKIQPSILSSYFCIGLVVLFVKIKYYYYGRGSAKRWGFVFHVIGFLFLTMLVVFLGSKLYLFVGVGVLGFFMIHFLIYSDFDYKKMGYMVMVGIVVGVGVFVYQNDYLKNRFRGLSTMVINYEDNRTELYHLERFDSSRWTSISYRVALINCGWEAVKEHFVFGVGIGGKMAVLLKKYEEKGFKLAIDRKSLLHNSYLEVWLATGLVGLVIFVWVFYYEIINGLVVKENFYYLGIVVVLGMGLGVDNVLDRFQGVVPFSFFLTLLNSLNISSTNIKK